MSKVGALTNFKRKQRPTAFLPRPSANLVSRVITKSKLPLILRLSHPTKLGTEMYHARAAIIDYCYLAGSNHCCLAKPSSSPATCRLCEYQCCLAGNNDLHIIAVDSAW